MRLGISVVVLASLGWAALVAIGAEQPTSRVSVAEAGRWTARLSLPEEAATAKLVRRTLGRYLQEFYGIPLGTADGRPSDKEPTTLVIGTADNNPLMAELARDGAKLTETDLGEEGFQLVTHERAGKRYVLVHARSPRAVKHGLQELIFYHMPAGRERVWVDWPLEVVRRPQIAYRGCYILPCWSAYDSLESWRRVLLFNSELTLNRNWFWLDGFPVAGHTGEYGGTALADEKNVQSLIDLARDEEMKLLIGGGWFNWHHEKAVGRDLRKGIDHYLAYLNTFRNFDGFYIEPTGEGSETGRWKEEAEALKELIGRVLKQQPEFEFALAIGQFNNPNYLKMMAELDPKRVYWWWCWGDPLRDKALDLFPSIVRWHTTTQMSNYHGSINPPMPEETRLAGVATSYDPGQGFGNPWNGWGKLGVDAPRDFDPYTLPYLAHQYYYRERCWDPKISEWEMTRRLYPRLFDEDAPKEAGHMYWWLSRLVHAASMNQKPTQEQLADPKRFLAAVRGRDWTPKMTDTLRRMNEAMEQLDKLSAAAQPK